MTAVFSLLMINSCEVFNPTYEEYELYGTWSIQDFSLDIDVSGDNFLQVMAVRALISAAKVKFQDELEEQMDSVEGSVTFNEDYTYYLTLFEDADTGTWHFNEDENSISLTAEETTIDYLNIEKLNAEQLIISWISEPEEFESDSTEESITIQVTIEAVFNREEL